MSCHDSFFLNETATTEIYTYCHTLSLHDALPILTLIPHSVIIRRLMSDTMRLSHEAPVVMRSAPTISSSPIRPPHAPLRSSRSLSRDTPLRSPSLTLFSFPLSPPPWLFFSFFFFSLSPPFFSPFLFPSFSFLF